MYILVLLFLILLLLCIAVVVIWFRNHILDTLRCMIRAVLLLFYCFKVSRVLTTYSVTFISRVMIVEELCIVKLTFISVFLICL